MLHSMALSPGSSTRAKGNAVASSKLKLVGRYPAWGPDAREARLNRPDGSAVSTMVRVLEDKESSPQVLGRLRDDAALLSRIRHENVLHVEHVTAVGGHAAMVYEFFEAVSLRRALRFLTERGQVLPVRAALEAAAAVATALDAGATTSGTAGGTVGGTPRIIHTGPTPQDVVVDALGRVKVGGFSVWNVGDPVPICPPGYGAPEGAHGPGALVYGVGALIVELLTGEAPLPGSVDEAMHESALRRMLIRVVSRPGEGMSQVLGETIRQVLSRTPESRPAPGVLARRLREMTITLHSPGLRTWAPASVPAILAWRPEEAQEGEARGEAGQPVPPAPAVPQVPPPVVVAAPPPLGVPPVPEARGGGRPPTLASPFAPTAPGPGPRGSTLVPPEPDRGRSGLLRGLGSLDEVPIPHADSSDDGDGDGMDRTELMTPELMEKMRKDPRQASRSAAAAASPVAPAPQVVPPPVRGTGAEPVDRGQAVPARPAPAPSGPSAMAPVAAGAAVDVEAEAKPRRKSAGGLIVLFGVAAVAVVVLAGVGWTLLGVDGGDAVTDAEVETPPTPTGLLGVLPEGAGTGVEPPPVVEEPGTLADLAPAPPDRTAPGTAPAVETPPAVAAPPQAVAAPVSTAASSAASPASTSRASSSASQSTTATTTSSSGGTSQVTAVSKATDPSREAPTAASPPAAPPAAPPPAEPPPVSTAEEFFRVEFRSGDPNIKEFEVRCHRGSGKGPPPLVLADAGKGPCRVTGTAPSGEKYIAPVVIVGPRTYVCFAGGARSCQ